MAQTNTLFAITLDNLTQNEESWLLSKIKLLEEFFESSLVFDRNSDFTSLSEFHEYEQSRLPFEYRFDVKELSLYSMDGEGGTAVLATLLWLFIQKCRPTQTVTLTYALTCSRPISGAFSGGGMRIDSNGWNHFGVDDNPAKEDPKPA